MEKETDKELIGSTDPEKALEKLKKILAKIKKSAKASKDKRKLMIG